MNPADRNKILIAAGVAIVAIIVIVFFLRGRKPTGTESGAGAFAPTAEAEAEGGEAPAATGPAVERGEAPAAAGLQEGAAAAGAEPTVTLGVVAIGSGAVEPTRPDPFLTFEPPPRPTPPELLISLPPVALAPGGLRPGGPSDVPRVAGRRVAGLLFDDQAYAILEQEDETFIVKPGDVVDGIRITAIARDSIYLVDEDGQRWAVPLRGLGPGDLGGGFGGRVSGMPEMPPAAP